MKGKIETNAEWIKDIIQKYINESPENSLKNDLNDKAWAEPLVAFSSGSDPLYKFYKEDIGQFYLTPMEIFTLTFPTIKTTSDQLTVISWILPQTEVTKSD